MADPYAQEAAESVAERPPPVAGNRRGTRASTAVHGDALADPSVYLPVRAGPSSRGRRARTTVVPTESGVLRQDQETIRLRLTLHLLTIFRN